MFKTKYDSPVQEILEKIWNIEPDTTALDDISPKLAYCKLMYEQQANAPTSQLLDYIAADTNSALNAKTYLEYAFRFGHKDIIPQLLDLFMDAFIDNKYFYMKTVLQSKTNRSVLFFDYFDDIVKIEDDAGKFCKLIMEPDYDTVKILDHFVTKQAVTMTDCVTVLEDIWSWGGKVVSHTETFYYILDNLHLIDNADDIFTRMITSCCWYDLESSAIKIVDFCRQNPNFESEILGKLVFELLNLRKGLGINIIKYLMGKYPDFDLNKNLKNPFGHVDDIVMDNAYKILGSNLDIESYKKYFIIMAMRDQGTEMFELAKTYIPTISRKKITKFIMYSDPDLQKLEYILDYCDDYDLILTHVESFDKIKLVLDKGANPNCYNGRVLYRNLVRCEFDILALLIQYGGNIDLVQDAIPLIGCNSFNKIWRHFNPIKNPFLDGMTLVAPRSDIYEVKYVAATKFIDSLIRKCVGRVIDQVKDTTPTVKFFNDLAKELIGNEIAAATMTHYDKIPILEEFLDEIMSCMNTHNIIPCERKVYDPNQKTIQTYDTDIDTDIDQENDDIDDDDDEFDDEDDSAEDSVENAAKIEAVHQQMQKAIDDIFASECIHHSYQIDVFEKIRNVKKLRTKVVYYMGTTYRMHRFIPYFKICIEKSCGKLFIALLSLLAEESHLADLLELQDVTGAEIYITLAQMLCEISSMDADNVFHEFLKPKIKAAKN
jgi:hypothetical protein